MALLIQGFSPVEELHEKRYVPAFGLGLSRVAGFKFIPVHEARWPGRGAYPAIDFGISRLRLGKP